MPLTANTKTGSAHQLLPWKLLIQQVEFLSDCVELKILFVSAWIVLSDLLLLLLSVVLSIQRLIEEREREGGREGGIGAGGRGRERGEEGEGRHQMILSWVLLYYIFSTS